MPVSQSMGPRTFPDPVVPSIRPAVDRPTFQARIATARAIRKERRRLQCGSRKFLRSGLLPRNVPPEGALSVTVPAHRHLGLELAPKRTSGRRAVGYGVAQPQRGGVVSGITHTIPDGQTPG